MTYRDRIGKAREADLQEYEVAKDYRALFASPLGQRVLDHIVQHVCGVDAIVKVATDADAHTVLARKNVGLYIARMALDRSDDDNNVKVNT